MKKFLSVISVLLALLMVACVAAIAEGETNEEAQEGVITEHGEIVGEEWYKDGEFIEDYMACHYSPLIHRIKYEDGYYEDQVEKVAHKWVLIDDTATCTEPGEKTYVCENCGDIKTEKSKALGHDWSSDPIHYAQFHGEWGIIIDEADCTPHNGLAQDYCLRCGVMGEKTRVILAPPHVFDGPVLDYKPHCYNPDVDVVTDPENELWTEVSQNGVEVTYVKGKIHDECIFCGAIDEESYEYIDLDEYHQLFGDDDYDGHDWDAWVIEVPYDCYEAGKEVRWCMHCGTDMHRDHPALNHSTNFPDYDNYGLLVWDHSHIVNCFERHEVYFCSECGEEFDGYFDNGEFKYETYPTESHIYPDAAAAAKAAGGVIDNATYKAWAKDASIAPYLDKYTAPDCENDGEVWVKCIYHDEDARHQDNEDGDDELKFVIKALGHKWSPWVVEHRVDEQGNKYGHWVRTCERCGQTKDYNGNYSPEECKTHIWEEEPIEVVDATCAEEGSITKRCKVCGTLETETIEKLPHTFVETVKEATCEEDGMTIRVCSVCGHTETEVGEKATGHDYVAEVVVEATCKGEGKDGKILYTCSKCGDLYTETVKAPEHVIVVDEAVPAEVGKAGKTEGSHCSACGDVIVAQEEIPAIVGNTFELSLDNVTMDDNTSGTGTVVREGTEELQKLYARVTWVYTLSNGDSFAYCAMKEVKSAEEANTFTFNMTSPKKPYGATLDSVQVALVTDAEADASGSYDALAFAKK